MDIACIILMYTCANVLIKLGTCLTITCRAWKNKLRTVTPENQVEIYQTLSILAKEMDPSVFQKQMSSFIQLWLPIELEVLHAKLSEPSRYRCNGILFAYNFLHYVIAEKWSCILRGAVITMYTLVILFV